MAEGADYVADAAAIGVALVAIWLSGRPHGYPNATAWAALVNAGWLLTLTALVASVAIARLISGAREVRGLPVLIVSTLAAVAMVVGALLLGDENEDDEGGNLNMGAILLDTAADAAAAAAVAVTP